MFFVCFLFVVVVIFTFVFQTKSYFKRNIFQFSCLNKNIKMIFFKNSENNRKEGDWPERTVLNKVLIPISDPNINPYNLSLVSL